MSASRKLTKKEQKIAAFSRALELAEHAKTPLLPAWVEGCNMAEERFARRAIEKNLGNVHRAGWPDFLIEEVGGGIYAVEVKSNADILRANQATMFTALDTNGVRVYVWNPSNPGRLVPWRVYLARSAQGQREERQRLEGASRDRAREKRHQRDRVVNSEDAETADRHDDVEQISGRRKASHRRRG